ncbi:MAG: hypothetical protein FWD60_13380 [Candidatus Azobacteroides sp.]|nr:hypothetical protein [Candidatus Azobacteroides sp.]
MASRIIFIFALIFSGIANPLSAQEEKKQSFSLSLYPLTMSTITKDQSKYMHDNGNSRGIEYEALFGNYGYRAVGYDTYHYGALEVSYKRVLIDRLQLNLGLGCDLSSKHWDIYDIPDGPRLKRIMDYRIIFMSGLDFVVLNNPQNKLRFSGQAGVLWLHRGLKYFDDNERDKQNFAWQFWYLYNRQITDSFWFDIGVGYGVFGVFKMGVSYLF